MEWISVKDKLPPLQQDVLVLLTTKPFSHVGANYMKVSCLYERILYAPYDAEETKKDIFWMCSGEPTHWMFLPDLPIKE